MYRVEPFIKSKDIRLTICGRDSNVSHYFFFKLEFKIGDFNVSVTFFGQLRSYFQILIEME